jgi:hypothetical protein
MSDLSCKFKCLGHSLAIKRNYGKEHHGGDGRVNTPRRCSFSRPFAPLPPFFPRRLGVGCAHLHFPPKATEPVLQSSARRCMCVRGTLWSYPREINQARLRSLRESDELAAEDHLLRQLQVLTARRLIARWAPLHADFYVYDNNRSIRQ